VTRSLGARALDGFRWGGISVAANAALQLGFTAALARLLDPAAFGLMAMGSLALRLFAYVSQLGLGAALVQRERLGEDDVRCALGLTWLVSGAASLGVAASAPLLGWFFRNGDVVPLVRWMGPVLLLQSLGGISNALLRRALRFRALAAMETASYVAGYGVVGVGTALVGAGVWSLVAASWGQAALALVLGWAVTRHPLRPALSGDRKGLLDYGVRHSFITFLEFAGANVDSAIVGRLLGEATLGVYNRALVLSYQPVERAAGILSRVLFPLLSAVQGDRRKVGGAFLLGLAVIGVLGAAMSLGLAAAADDVVRLLLGPGWGGAARVIEVLALAVPLLFMSNVAGVVCDALALLRFKVRVQALGLAANGGLMLALSSHGLRGIAAAIVMGESLRFAVYLGFLGGELGCDRRELLRVLAAPLLAGGLAFAACAGAVRVASGMGLGTPAAVGLEVAAGLAALAGAGLAAVRLLDGTSPARLAETSLPGWQRLRARLAAVGV
jgi:O-antigen/teichoic acid export membrane protein